MTAESPTAHVAAVVLAAGASTRLGAAKQLVIFRGVTLVRRAAEAARDAGASPVIVVLGAAAELVAQSLSGVGGVATVMNERWQDGLASSLAAGIREAMCVAPSCDGVLITTADQPLVSAESLGILLSTFAGGARLVAAEYAGTIGVPAVVGREHFESMLALSGDAGAGRWLRARTPEVARVTIPDAALDIDSAEDAVKLEALA